MISVMDEERAWRMDLTEKLAILGESARYDVSCSSSGSRREGKPGHVGNTVPAGLCHTWTADGRCVSLLKVLQTNQCVYDCVYCINRCSNQIRRTRFEPDELADLTMAFYRRNYIEGLFLSSAVWRCPDDTMELMIATLKRLREQYRFNGYIHAKAIPGCSDHLLEQMGRLADRVSINIEQCTTESLRLLAPQKAAQAIFQPIRYLSRRLITQKDELAHFRHTPRFSPAGQTTQIIVGASAEKDLQILRTAQKLYDSCQLKRVYYSAYLPINDDQRLPSLATAPPLLREHRLYQADWLLRFYQFTCDELIDESQPDLDLALDPKSAWAVRHLDQFPIELNQADYEQLLRVPGIGIRSARRIVAARRHHRLTLDDLKGMRISMKRAGWFITCNGRYGGPFLPNPENLRSLLCDQSGRQRQRSNQISLEEIYADSLCANV